MKKTPPPPGQPGPEEPADAREEGAPPAERPYPRAGTRPGEVREPVQGAAFGAAKRGASPAERWLMRGPPVPPAAPARYPITEFRDEIMRHVEMLRRSGEPAVLTRDGEALLVVQEAGAYQRLLDRLEHAEAAMGIREGLDSARRGEGRPAADLLHELRAKYGPDRPR